KQSIDNSNNQHHKIILSPLEATLKLRENQLSFLLQRNNGVYRYDTNQLASNNPIEDTKYELIVPSSKNGGDRLFFGVFDGHAGWNTSQLLSKKLIPYVREQLDKAYDGYGEYSKLISNKEGLISKAIQNGFTELDEEIVFHSIDRLIQSHQENIAWSVRVLSPQDISWNMLKMNKYNLNAQAHDTTIELIRQVLTQGVNVTEIYIDTVGPPESYKAKLSNIFPGIDIIVEKKADSKYPIVSAASICAKVTRDQILKHWTFVEKELKSSKIFGSGYPS
ncbi:16108_t:CDS:2, partial [Dentiscutata heterogama]